jgi:hypothetical protein
MQVETNAGTHVEEANRTSAFVHTKCRNKDGTFDCFRTQSVPVRVSAPPRRGSTVTGYGESLPTPYEVLFNGRWRRVRLAKRRNTSTAYLGSKLDECLTLTLRAV